MLTHTVRLSYGYSLMRTVVIITVLKMRVSRFFVFVSLMLCSLTSGSEVTCGSGADCFVSLGHESIGEQNRSCVCLPRTNGLSDATL